MEKPDLKSLAKEQVHELLKIWNLGEEGKMIAESQLIIFGDRIWNDYVTPLQEKVKQQDKEYVLNGSIEEWKDYANRTKSIIDDLRKRNAELTAENEELVNACKSALFVGEIKFETCVLAKDIKNRILKAIQTKMKTIYINGIPFSVSLLMTSISPEKLCDMIEIPANNATVSKVYRKILSGETKDEELEFGQQVEVNDNDHFKIMRNFVLGN